MTRLKSIGFETGDFSEFDTRVEEINAIIVRSGTYAGRLSGSSQTNIAYIPERYEIFIGTGIYITNQGSSGRLLFGAYSGGGTGVANISSSGAGDIYNVRTGTTSLFPVTLTQNEWHYLEMHVYIDSVDGRVELKLNGSSVGSYDGNLGSSPATYIQFGVNTTSTNTFLVDDILVNDSLGEYNNSWVGQPKLIPAEISADGSRIELTRGGVDSGANWSQVSPIPPSDTGYVTSGSAEEGDLYEHAAFPALPVGATINNLIVCAQARVESGVGSFTTILKSGTTDEEGEIKALTNTYKTFSDAYPVDEGSAPWTLDRVNDAEVGVLNKEFV
jgi:hypothetical protein